MVPHFNKKFAMSARANTKTPGASREKRQELARLRHEANHNKPPPFPRLPVRPPVLATVFTPKANP